MIKTEYWKMGDSVFIKTQEDGIFKDSKSIPLNEVPKDIIDKFNNNNETYYFTIDGDIQSEIEAEEVLKPKKASGEPLKNESIGTTDPFDTTKPVVLPDTQKVESYVNNLDKDKLDTDELTRNSEGLISSKNVDQIDPSDISMVSTSDVNNYVEHISTPKTETDSYDFVQKPIHYNGHKIITKSEQEFEYETIELIEAWLRRHEWMPIEAKYSAGNAIKYLDRVGNKPEDGKSREEKAAEDFEKISWYALRAAKALRGKLYKKED